MIRFEEIARPTRLHHALGPAKYKLPIRLVSDRRLAAELLLAARKTNRRCTWRDATRWRNHLDLAASFAAQERDDLEESAEDSLFRVYDHLAHVMEGMVDLAHLRGG